MILEIPRILGTAQIDTSYGVTRQITTGSQESEWLKILAAGKELGFSALDTATAYRGAHSIIGRSAWSGEIHTKISNIDETDSEYTNATMELESDEIAVVYFHQSWLGLKEPEKMRTAALRLLRRDVGAIGISIYSPDELDCLLGIREISVIQLPLSIIDQRFLGAPLAKALSAGKRIITRSVFLQGVLAGSTIGTSHSLPAELRYAVRVFFDICRNNSLDPVEVCLSFVRSLHGLSGIVLGVENFEQARALQKAWSGSSRLTIDWNIFSDIPMVSPLIVDPRNWR